jgi:hypothetical protein
MSANDDAHDFQVQHEKPDNLPGKELAPEPCRSGWIGGIRNLFWAGNNMFFLHDRLF